MTLALCLNCGEIKWGAICPCQQCKVPSSGDMNLDIAFTDHYWAEETLSQLGAVIQTIAPHSQDSSLRIWAFLQFVSDHHPDILKVELQPHQKAEVAALLKDLVLPPVKLQRSRQFERLTEKPPK